MTPRDEWLLMCNMSHVNNINSSGSDEELARQLSRQQQDLARNLSLTRRAIAMGAALSALDGPLPVMDTVAFVGVTAFTSVLWGKYYLDYYV